MWLNTGLAGREAAIREMAESLSADGVLFHPNRSCKPYSFGQERIAGRLKKTGIPCIVLEGDMADERDFGDGAWETRLEAFIEQLEHGRGRMV